MEDGSVVEQDDKCNKTLVVHLPGFEDDLIIIHCEVVRKDPISAFRFIEVSGVLLDGHLTEPQVRDYVSHAGLPGLEDPEKG